jgi:hypothetical protein
MFCLIRSDGRALEYQPARMTPKPPGGASGWGLASPRLADPVLQPDQQPVTLKLGWGYPFGQYIFHTRKLLARTKSTLTLLHHQSVLPATIQPL